MRKIANNLKTIAISTLGLALGFPNSAFAAGDPCGSDVPEQVRAASGCGGGSDDQLFMVVQNILYTIIAISGIVAVVYIVLGGINYMTSTGDPGKVQKARQTILYAAIGLVVCALAFAIVNFTINYILNQA